MCCDVHARVRLSRDKKILLKTQKEPALEHAPHGSVLPAAHTETSPGRSPLFQSPSIAHTAGPYRTARGQHPTAEQLHRGSPKPGAFRSQIEIFPVPHPTPPPPHAGRPRQRTRKRDGLGAVLLALRRQPVGGGHLRRDGRALRGHLLAPHLPHRHLQLPPRLHRAPLPQARLHEVHLLRRRRLLLPARRLLLVEGQEDGPRRDQPQGRRAGALAGQAQVRRRRRRRALRRLRPAQLALRGPRRRKAALRTGAARPAHEPPRPARERPDRLRHGIPLLPLLHEHPDQPPEAARLHAAPCGRRGRRGALRHARSKSQLSCVYTYM